MTIFVPTCTLLYIKHNIEGWLLNRTAKLIVLVCVVILLGGCALQNPRTRALVVINDTADQEITYVGVTAFHVVDRKMGYNALPEGTTLHPGQRVTVHFAPAVGGVQVEILSNTVGETDYHNDNVYLSSRAITGQVWDAIEARYGQYTVDVYEVFEIEFGGKGYLQQDVK